MPSTLWTPSEEVGATLTSYERWLEETRGLRFESYEALWRWSVSDLEERYSDDAAVSALRLSRRGRSASSSSSTAPNRRAAALVVMPIRRRPGAIRSAPMQESDLAFAGPAVLLAGRRDEEATLPSAVAQVGARRPWADRRPPVS